MNGPELYLLSQRLMTIAGDSMPGDGQRRISPAGRLILSDVARNLGTTASDLAERTGLRESQVSALVDELAGTGLLTVDSGRIGISHGGMTGLGRPAGAPELPAIDKSLAGSLGTADPDSVAEVTAILEALARRLGTSQVLRGITDFDAAYRGTPPWETGRPQPAFAELAERGAFRGRVLDVGCGTGEHALLAASAGLEAAGIDASPTAISLARQKALDRNLTATFMVHDALDLAPLGERFDTVLDSALFHVFSDEERVRYAGSLRAAVPPGGRYFMLCFSDRHPAGFGPRRVSEAEIRSCFADGWRVDAIEPVTLEVTISPDGVKAWLASLTRV